MPKDVKTGMLIGAILCFIAAAWFCAKREIITTPLMKIELQQNQLPKADAGSDVQEVTEQTIIMNAPSPPQIVDLHDKNVENFTIHTVLPGQTLTDISKIYYNSPYGWKKIYEANREKLPYGPDTIKAGMKLIIPK